MKRDFPFVRRNYDTIVAGTNLFVFLFGMTAVVYETQHRHNPAIGNYLDALYFTVATLTTTGFGDIAYRDGRSIARNRDDDRRCQPVCADGAGAVPAQEGAPEVPLVRALRA